LNSQLKLANIGKDVEAGRILLDRYDFNSYTLVRVSNLRHYVQMLNKLTNLDEILSIEELQDKS